jgi:D-serine deaminase-like pyridoxal phosphate-dependent protein
LSGAAAWREELRSDPIDWRYKGFPAADGVTPANVAAQGWELLAGDLLLPALVLKEEALAANAALMARWCAEHGASLAPHGKTTMSPELFARQLAAGAWAITAATTSHVRAYRRFGVPRVVLANQVVEPAAVRWIARELAADPDFELLCLVDSAASVAAVTAAWPTPDAADAPDGPGGAGGRRLPVLVELGIPGTRTGCRSVADALAVAEAVAASPALALAGVEAFEGVVASDDVPGAVATVDRLVADVWALAAALDARGLGAGRDELVVSIGGSTWFDRVVAAPRPPLGRPARLVLRSGCYLTHDSGLYHRLSPLDGRGDGPSLRAALEVWGVVLSRPEPTRALVGLGKRDVSHDVEPPIPLHAATPGRPAGALRDVRDVLRIVALNDQHAWVDLPADDPLAVGDLVGCGISHPCTTLDKWRLIPVVDAGYRVVDAVHTFF